MSIQIHNTMLSVIYNIVSKEIDWMTCKEIAQKANYTIPNTSRLLKELVKKKKIELQPRGASRLRKNGYTEIELKNFYRRIKE